VRVRVRYACGVVVPAVDQDNAKFHTGEAVAAVFEREGVGTDRTFPPYSPDLNPIENVWGLMAQRMAHYDVSSIAEMHAALVKQWSRIDIVYIQQLYGSWRDRLRAVIEADGGPTKY
jgi:transposase